MDEASLYDTDICTWAEQQAAAIRSLAGRRDLPNQLDLANLAEEIEDLGNSEQNAVSSLVRQILTHLVVAKVVRNSLSIPHWAGEVAGFHAEMMQHFQPSLRQRIDVPRQWSRALRVARVKLEAYENIDWSALTHSVRSMA